MIFATSSGSFAKTMAFLTTMKSFDILAILHRNGKLGVNALASATPVRSGLAASSWGYEVEKRGSNYTITWTNTDIENGFPVAISLQYGYATGTGGFVQGEDYINPAIRPIFDKISAEMWKVVTSA